MSQEIHCPSCNATVNLWDSTLRSLREAAGDFISFVAIGAQLIVFEIVMRAGVRTELRLADYGIPADARILSIIYTPYAPEEGGWLHPVELHGNAPHRYIIPTILTLYPVPSPNLPHPQEVKVAVAVTWIRHFTDEIAARSLIDAFDAFAARRHDSAVIPANTAVEMKLGSLLTDAFEQVLSSKDGKDRVKDFLIDGATYGHQLSVLLPFLAHRFGAPPLNEHIMGKLRRLKKLRNDVAHAGTLEATVHRSEVAECLCAALSSASVPRCSESTTSTWCAHICFAMKRRRHQHKQLLLIMRSPLKSVPNNAERCRVLSRRQ